MKMMRGGPNITSDSHGRLLCAADGCENPAAAEMTFDGIGYCMKHGNKIIKRHEQVKGELTRYRAYQEAAFGGLVVSRTTEDLQERLDALNRADRSDASDLHVVRLDAETTAITRELARRKDVAAS